MTRLAALFVVAALLAAPSLRADARELHVCADPNNLPFSNARGEGFDVEEYRNIGNGDLRRAVREFVSKTHRYLACAPRSAHAGTWSTGRSDQPASGAAAANGTDTISGEAGAPR